MSIRSENSSKNPSTTSTIICSENLSNVSSSYTRSSTIKSSCDCNLNELEKLRTAIRIKMIIMILTLIGGAILALGINIWPITGSDDDDDDGQLDKDVTKLYTDKYTYKKFLEGSIVQIYSPKLDLCLDDYDFNVEDDKTKAMAVRASPCNSRTSSQLFTYDQEKKLMGNVKLSHCFHSVPLLPDKNKPKIIKTFVYLTKCDPDNKNHHWNVSESGRIYNYGLNWCLSSYYFENAETAEERYIVLLNCDSNDAHQKWILILVDDKKLYSRKYVEDYPKTYGEL